MVDLDCSDCGAPLVPIASTVTENGRVAGGSYPSLFFPCPKCGAGWERNVEGVVTKRSGHFVVPECRECQPQDLSVLSTSSARGVFAPASMAPPLGSVGNH